MDNAEWKANMDRLCLIAGLLRDEPIGEMLNTLERVDSLGPILAPTAYHQGMDNVRDQRELLVALRGVQKVVEGLAPTEGEGGEDG